MWVVPHRAVIPVSLDDVDSTMEGARKTTTTALNDAVDE